MILPMMNLGYDSQAFEGWLNAPTLPYAALPQPYRRTTFAYHTPGRSSDPGHFSTHRTLYIVP